MNRILPTLCLYLVCFSATTSATNYYFSTAGNDSTNTGVSPTSPYQSIQKLNSLLLRPGDSILFRSGESFHGEINLSTGGTPDSMIVFTSYDSGQKPVISGAQTLSGWTLAGSVYQANLNRHTNNFFVNNQQMTLARFPNSGFLQLDTSNGTGGISDAQLNIQPAGYWDGSKICIRTCQWVWETTGISSYTPGQLSFTTPTQIVPLSNYGYFLYDKQQELDTAREWYYDTTAHVLSFIPPPGQVPDSQLCEASVINNGIRMMANVSFVEIANLHFDKQSSNGVLVTDSNSTHISVHHCIFTHQFLDGIQGHGKFNHFHHNLFDLVDGKGIEIIKFGYTEIDHNAFRNIGQYRNCGSGKQTNLEAIALQFVDSCYIHHNSIDSVGYTGIQADGIGHLVERNIVSHCMMLLTDGAPIKCFGLLSSGTTIRNNIISGSNGNPSGGFQANFKTPGIYFDFDVNHCLVSNNTIYNQRPKGIFLNGGNNFNTVAGNIIYGTAECIDLNAASRSNAVHDENIVHNVCFGLDSNNFSMRQSQNQAGNYTFGVIDSNYYFNPYNLTRCAYRAGIPPQYFDLADWQTQTGYDLNTKGSFESWTAPVNNSQLFLNATDTVAIIPLGSNIYLDLDSNSICGNIMLQPFTSMVLINTNQNCATAINPPPAFNAMSIYPNPVSSGTLHVASSGTDIKEVSIYSPLGVLLFRKFVDAEKLFTLDVSGISPGIYMLAIRSSEGFPALYKINIVR